MKPPGTLLLSRPDALGDAVVTLTTAGWIRHHAPSTHICAVIREYTRPVWERSTHVDRIITLEELERAGERGAARALEGTGAEAIVHVFPHRSVARWAKAAGIPLRVGTSHRWWHWTTCNERVSFSRRRSLLHEAQLNIRLLAPFGIPMPASIGELVPHIGLQVPPAAPAVRALVRPGMRNIILHPLLGSGVGWGLHNFRALIGALDPARHHVILTGTAAEAERYRQELPVQAAHVTDAGGRLQLADLLELMGLCDALVAASTGPLHLAAAAGIRAIGLYSMRRPIFPQRWAPIGRDAHALVHDPGCTACARGEACDCIQRISPAQVLALLDR